jgi:two-component system OmpR family response regulator
MKLRSSTFGSGEIGLNGASRLPYSRRVRLLVVEDDVKIARMLARGLGEEGFAVDVAGQGSVGVDRLRSGQFDICILDVLLPDLDGFAVLETARREGVRTPVLMLTARDAVSDRVRGLTSGADDYLTKPFAFAELLARLQLLLRRGTAPAPPSKVQVADVVFDAEARVVLRAGRALELSPKQYALLEFLLQHHGQAVSREMILRRVFGYTFDPGTNIVDVHVSNLRQKIDAGRTNPLIRTVRGVGYRLADDDAH